MITPENSTLFITGANGGIAEEIIRILLEKRFKRIVLACRTQSKAEQIKRYFQPMASTTELVAIGGFDMNDPDSMQTAVSQISLPDPIDIVFLQSGGVVLSKQYEFIEYANERIEKTSFQNAMGGYLTYRLLEHAGLLAGKAKIVFAGGEGARGIPKMIPKPEFRSSSELLSYLSHGQGRYNFMRAIGISKLISALLVQKLAINTENREFIWFSPGLTAGTKGLDNVPNPRRFLMKNIGFPIAEKLGIAQNPRQAAAKFVQCLLGQYGSNGDVLGAPEGKTLGKIVDQKPMNTALTNHQLRDAVAELAENLASKILA